MRHLQHLGAFFIISSIVGGLCSSCDAFSLTENFVVGGGSITVHVQPQAPPIPVGVVMGWVKMAAKAVSDYYGRFPVPSVDITISTGDTLGRVHHGVTYHGRRITIDLAQNTDEEDLRHDWELTHEMFHLAFPLLDDDYDWMGEGLSDYAEPIARARIGVLSDEIVWRDFVEGLPKGLPRAGDQGLDHTHTWGRIYWGGVIYWLSADLEIRRRTHQTRSLHDALQAILDDGGNGQTSWTLEDVLKVGDKATGTTVLTDVHEQMGNHPFAPDLSELWKRLGVVYHDRVVTFNDEAPEAALRKSLTAK